MFDVDHFKSINDSYGHDVGDQVLVELCELIKGHLRRGEVFGRLGGEEFGILVPLTAEQTAIIGHRLLELIAKHRFTDQEISITVSMGLVDNQQSSRFQELYREADRLMYVAKNAGRNCLQS